MSPPNFLQFWQEIPNIDFHESWNTKYIFYLLKIGNRSQKEEAKVGQMLKQSVLVCLRRLKFFNCSLRCSMDAIGQTDISVIESKLFISFSRESVEGNNLCYLIRYFCVGYIHICFYWTHGSTIDSPKNLNLTSNILQLTIFAFLLQFDRWNNVLLHEKDFDEIKNMSRTEKNGLWGRL